ncbi:MAG: hypothetical protein DCC53_16545 [Chloroflexi bacterium]|nr:MAG: hypothetical protein DCC53_16545 [Chloroflexota bacterium]
MKTQLRVLVTLFVTLSLAACTLGAAGDVPVTVVVITNTAPAGESSSGVPITPVVPPTAAQLEPTSSPEPVATPIADPAAALAAADRDAHDGFYERAKQRYSALFTVSPEASAGYAKIALREGDFGGALTALNSWLTLNPDDPRSADSYFLRGEANLGVGRWTTAINDYRQYLRLRPGVIENGRRRSTARRVSRRTRSRSTTRSSPTPRITPTAPRSNTRPATPCAPVEMLPGPPCGISVSSTRTRTCQPMPALRWPRCSKAA